MLSALSQHLQPEMGADPVKDVGISTFLRDVLEASKERLVIVDFWAEWCGPCKQLGPVLEKLVRSYKGSVHLAKIDIDKNPQISQQMGVQSIPAVFAFFRGQPIDGFMGALPEAQIKAWLDRLVKAAGGAAPATENFDDALKHAAELLAARDIDGARTIYSDILGADPSSAAAYAGVVRCLIASGDVQQAQDMLAKALPEMAKDKAFEAARAALELAQQVPAGREAKDLQARLEHNPMDHQARFDLSMAHYAAGQREDAVEQLLEIVRRARNWNEDAARKQLVKFFEAFGPTDPLTIAARKRLSSILFA